MDWRELLESLPFLTQGVGDSLEKLFKKKGGGYGPPPPPSCESETQRSEKSFFDYLRVGNKLFKGSLANYP